MKAKMKIMTYNIYRGGGHQDLSRIDYVTHSICDINPDILAVQEANNFEDKNYYQLKKFAKMSGFNHYQLGNGMLTKSNNMYHVALFSKTPIEVPKQYPNFRNGNLNAIIDTDIGKINVFNTHLNPFTEEERMKELEVIIKNSKRYPQSIILGDLNSLSYSDDYDPKIKDTFNRTQKEKFTKDDKLQFEVIKRLEKKGFTDTAKLLNLNNIPTVPTRLNKDPGHKTQLRLDYIFVSEELAKNVVQGEVVKTSYTNAASDHYPFYIEVKNEF
jgi:endonuclease/exonuclease/phosphatase family metal-dependent hydrolase